MTMNMSIRELPIYSCSFAPLENKRRIKITDHRCRKDWAEVMKVVI